MLYLSSFVVGALVAAYSVGHQWQHWVLLGAFVLLLFLLHHLRGYFYARQLSKVTLCLCWVLGVGWTQVHWESVNGRAMPEQADKANALIVGQVLNIQPSDDGPTYFDFVDHQNTQRYLVSCYQCQLDVSNGQTWTLNISIRPFRRFANPGGFDYRRWMISQGYTAQGYVLKSGHQRITEGQSSLVSFANLRAQVLSRIQSVISNQPGSGWLKALLLGDKSDIGAEDKRVLSHSGLGHLFVVSGLHIGLAFAALMVVARWLLRPMLSMPIRSAIWGVFLVAWLPRLSLLLGFAGAVFYAWISGFQVPAIRALVMVLLFGWLWLSAVRVNPGNIFLLAIVFVVLVDPLAFANVGPWLSFGIVGSLIWAFSGVPHGSLWRGLLRSQGYAFVAGSSILILFQMNVALIGIALNLIFIPLFTLLVMPWVLFSVMLLFSGIEEPLLWSGQSLAWLFEILNGLIAWSVKISLFTGFNHSANAIFLVACMILLLLPLERSVRGILVFGLLIAIVIKPAKLPSGTARVTVLDVGQGSAALVETKNHTMLVDSGRNFASGMAIADYVLMPYLRQKGIHQIDRLHITHEDMDHNGGATILKRWGPRILDHTAQGSCENRLWQWDGVRFNQFKSREFKTGNNGSCLLNVSVEGHGGVLFSGDIERKAESDLVKHLPENLKADVLVVPHHGSKTSSSSVFLKAVNPRWSIISAGRFNGYGHPHQEVVDRLKANRVQVLSTSSHGSVQVLITSGHGASSVSTYRPY